MPDVRCCLVRLCYPLETGRAACMILRRIRYRFTHSL